MKTIDQAKADLLTVLRHLRFAVEEAQKNGAVKLGILSVRSDGGGKIECRFDSDFLDDLALVIDAQPMTEQDRMDARAAKFKSLHGL